MTADYAEPLKRAWAEIDCPYSSPCKSERPCRGHAALLEMVDSYSRTYGVLQGATAKDITTGELAEDRERRRLRAAVGVADESKRA